MKREIQFTPPPRGIMNSLPDYVHGRLIFEDTSGENNCRWVVYDGRRFIRTPSRRAAEQLAAQQQKEAHTSLDDVYLAMHHLQRAEESLQTAVKNSSIVHKLTLQAYQTAVGKLSAKIDDFIYQNSHRYEENTNDNLSP